MTTSTPRVTIYSDGGCKPNPGPGGWGAVLIFDSNRRELSGGETDTTNNRMELTAAISALDALSGPHQIDFYTDSTYVRNGITKWIHGWIKKEWRGVKNVDLWRKLHAATQRHTIDWHWVKGHAGNTENERVDDLASAEIARLHDDLGLNEDTDAPADVQIYTASSGTQKSSKGGYAAVIVQDGDERAISDTFTKTTVNAIIIQAAIDVLKDINPDVSVDYYSDSEYLIKGISQWVDGWKKRGWKTASGGAVKNQALWATLDRLTADREIRWKYLNRKDNPYSKQLAARLKQGTGIK